MPAVAAIATVAGSAISSRASSKAASTQAAAADRASESSLQAARETNELNKEIYDQTRADNEAWRIAGQNALASLAGYKAPVTTPNVGNWYTNVMGKEADAEGRAYWEDQLKSGRSADDVYRSFLTSGRAMQAAKSGNVDDWYKSDLGRAADAEGKAYWESELRSGKDPAQVYQSFLESARAGGATINQPKTTWQDASMSAQDYRDLNSFADANISDPDSAYANARFSDPDSAYANTDIGSKLSEYRNPDFGMDGFGNTNLKDADAAYANPQLRNLLANFSMSDFEADPGYQYRLEQGGRAVENSAASRGMQLSGATLKALARFGQNEGAAEYDRAFNRFRTQKLDQYGQSVDDFGRTEAQRREKYGQRMDEYGLNEAQRAAKYGIATDQFGRAELQRQEQYGQRVDKFGRDEGQRIDKYGQRVDEFGRLEGQRQDKYAQRTDLYNRLENQRINRYGISQDQRARGVSDEERSYNRLAEIAGIGQRVNESNAAGGRAYAGQVSANTTNAATAAGNYLTGGANARAAGYIGRSNAIGDAVGQGINMWQQDKLLERLARPNYGVAQQSGVANWVSQG